MKRHYILLRAKEKIGLVIASVLALGAMHAQAQTRYFNVANGNWSVATNWSGSSLPPSNGIAYIGSNVGGVLTGTAAILSGDSISLNRVIIGSGTGANGTLNVTGGTLNAVVTGNGAFFVGDAGGTGALNLSGGNIATNSQGMYIGRGDGSVGSVSVSSGTLQVASILYVGGANVGTFTGSSSGTLTVTGGSVISSGVLRISGAPTGTGNISTGVVNQSSGLISASGVEIQTSGSGSGTYNLSGGELRLGVGGSNTQINRGQSGGGTGTATFNWSGGTISVGDSSQLTLAQSLGTVNLQSGGSGAVFNTTNSSGTSAVIVVSSGLNGDGGLTIRGSGTVSYSLSSSSYTGGTAIESGTLLLANTNGHTFNSSKVSVASGATIVASSGPIVFNHDLVGAGTVTGAVTVKGNMSGGDFGTLGTLTLSQTLTLDGGAFTFDFLNTSQADLITASSLSLAGDDPVVITVNGLAGYVVQAGDIFTVFQGSTAGLTASDFQVNNLSSWTEGFDVLVGANSVQLQAVPEPSACVLLAGGTALLALWLRRKHHSFHA